MKRLIVLAAVLFAVFAFAPAAEAGPIRRAIRGIARVATAPVRAVRGRGHGVFHGRHHSHGCTNGVCR